MALLQQYFGIDIAVLIIVIQQQTVAQLGRTSPLRHKTRTMSIALYTSSPFYL